LRPAHRRPALGRRSVVCLGRCLGACALAAPGLGHPRPVGAVRGEHAVEASEIDARFGHQAQQADPADKPADNMQLLGDKIRADKKLVVGANMDLTEGEAKKFWPVYDEYQQEPEKINKQLGGVIADYAKAFNAGSLTDEKAKALLDRWLAANEAEVKLQKSFVPKLSKALPTKKVVRYLQIESKIRAIVKFELAKKIPLVP
jgi:hypothetical protein